MPHNTSFSLSEELKVFVESEVATGRYNSSSEVIRAGIRLLKEREERIAAFDAAIEEGESSSVVEDFDPEAFLSELNARHEETA